MIFGALFRAGWAAADAVAKASVSALVAVGQATEVLAVKMVVRTIFLPKTIGSKVGSAFQSLKHAFGSQPAASPVQACILKSSQEKDLLSSISSWKELIRRAKETRQRCPMITDTAINSLQKQVDDSEKAIMSKDVYDPPPGGGVPDWTRISDQDLMKAPLHLNPKYFHPEHSEFRAALYKSNDVPPKYTLAFKGTTASSESDWENNILQGLGLESSYYNDAAKLAGKVFDSTGGRVEVTGHSLGGGLASAAAASAGVRGTTFNAAGLNAATVPGMTPDEMESKIDVYRVDGEPLTSAEQLGIGPAAVGKKHPIKAPADAGLLEKHSMDAVMYGMQQNGIPPAHKLATQIGECAAVGL